MPQVRAVAYQAAVAAHPLAAPLGLAGESASTPWDPELAATMRHHTTALRRNPPWTPCCRTSVRSSSNMSRRAWAKPC